jgi:arylsulfatase
MKMKSLTNLALAALVVAALATTASAADKPNIVLINMDNFGYGELGVYGGGITRGAPTPRIDKLASEGLRLTNFNVEAQCTPSRAALMTGRYAKRSGNASVPWLTGLYGLTQWEVTMAEMLADAGYATGMFGKWHLGQTEGRFPTDQGFDEWYGIPNSTDEVFWPEQQQFNQLAAEKSVPYLEPEYIYDGKKGSVPEKVKVYDVKARREIDREITDRTKDFMTRQVKAGKPFFAYVPYTMTHMPVLASKEFDGKSGNGPYADVLMQIDAYTGELLDTIDKLKAADNTIFIFTSDNGPEMLPEHHGWSGPWSGSYFTAKEGSLRVPFIMRWPGKVPAGRVSNEIVHQIDLFTTLAGLVGGKVPADRQIDGVDQTDFFVGKTDKSAREGFVVYVGESIFGVKWRNWKMLTKEFDNARGSGNIVQHGVPYFYNLYSDPKEAYPITIKTSERFWVRWPCAQIMGEHLKSLQAEPPIKAGTPDPYVPAKK